MILKIVVMFLVTIHSVAVYGGADLSMLSRSKGWLRLLHYDDSSPYESRIDTPYFFLSDTGKSDPHSELLKTIEALRDNQKGVGPFQLLPRCAFPARARFLERKLGVQFPVTKCEGIDGWREGVKVQSVSLVFSTAYPGNPASMFGHTFLKFNSGSGYSDPLRDYGASFSAAEEGDDSFSYFYKGLTGGYRGYFSLTPYYDKVAEYARYENRDLWEYRLNLDESESLFLLEHYWELYALANIDYFFFTENCSFILLGTIEASKPSLELTKPFFGVVTPHQTIMRLKEENGLVGEPTLRPSFRRRYYDNYYKASDGTIKAHKQVINGLMEVKLIQDIGVLDLSLDYLAYQRALSKENFSTKQKTLELKILNHRASLKVPSPRSDIKSQNQPDLAHPPYYLSLAADKENIYVGARYGFHSLSESSAGFEDNMHIEYGKFDIKFDRQKRSANLDSLTLMDVMALGRCGEVECPHSWRVFLGRDHSIGEEKEPFKGTGAVGYSLVRAGYQFWLMGGGGVQSTSGQALMYPRIQLNFGGRLNLTQRVSVLYDHQITESFSLKISRGIPC